MADQDASSTVASTTSELSDHYLNIHPELADAEIPVMTQQSCSFSFKRITVNYNIPLIESYPGALADLKGLNPDFYAMPYGVSVPHDHSLELY